MKCDSLVHVFNCKYGREDHNSFFKGFYWVKTESENSVKILIKVQYMCKKTQVVTCGNNYETCSNFFIESPKYCVQNIDSL